MIPVLDAARLKDADAFTIAHKPIASIALMERAALACAAWIGEHVERARPVLVLAGPGNNGGDGLALARLLHAEGRRVRVVLAGPSRQDVPDHEENRRRAEAAGVPLISTVHEALPPDISPDEVIVDALLGIGLSRPVTGVLKKLITAVNGLSNVVIAIDMPSGLFVGDNGSNDRDAIIRATHTLTLEVPKLSFFLAENAPFTGEWHVLPIGLDKDFIRTLDREASLMEPADMHALLPPRPRFAHKGHFGHAWLLAGSHGTMGAAVLAANACLRSGAGLLTVHVPAGTADILHIAAPAAMVSTDRSAKAIEELPRFQRCTAIGIGPGIGTSEATARLLKLLIQEAPAPLVLDADALNILAENRTWLSFLPPGTILTPHPKEFDRLNGASADGHARLHAVKDFARRHAVVLVLKGAYTAICAPDGQVFLNDTGNPGMAKGGSGDALTGVITALRAQGLDALHAALLGVHAHGLAGDLAAANLGMDGMTVSDLIEHLPQAWRRLRSP